MSLLFFFQRTHGNSITSVHCFNFFTLLQKWINTHWSLWYLWGVFIYIPRLEISMSKLCKPDLTNTACMSINNEHYFEATTHFFCVLFSAAPPVTFADIPEEDLFKSVVEQEQLVLSCEVSRADGVVQWYKDGTEMQPSNNITMRAEGTERNLTIHSAQLSDTGTYTCRAGDNVLVFKVNIRGNEIA